jgi:hypothetical protein
VKQAAEYRQQASDCRKMALNVGDKQRRHKLTKLAEAWEKMAVQREREVPRDEPDQPT